MNKCDSAASRERFRPFLAAHFLKQRIGPSGGKLRVKALCHITSYYYKHTFALIHHYYHIGSNDVALLPNYVSNYYLITTALLVLHCYMKLSEYYIITTRSLLLFTTRSLGKLLQNWYITFPQILHKNKMQ
jgi:hypothetical protein